MPEESTQLEFSFEPISSSTWVGREWVDEDRWWELVFWRSWEDTEELYWVKNRGTTQWRTIQAVKNTLHTLNNGELESIHRHVEKRKRVVHWIINSDDSRLEGITQSVFRELAQNLLKNCWKQTKYTFREDLSWQQPILIVSKRTKKGTKVTTWPLEDVVRKRNYE